jgi:hypothetical protein
MSANDVHFQAYLLEGVVRWNDDRMSAAVAGSKGDSRSYNDSLKMAVAKLHEKVYGQHQDFRPPSKYTGI